VKSKLEIVLAELDFLNVLLDVEYVGEGKIRVRPPEGCAGEQLVVDQDALIYRLQVIPTISPSAEMVWGYLVGSFRPEMEPAPKIALKNGIVVANFSSPHPFVFTSGEVLGACSEARAKKLSLGRDEVETAQGKWTDVNVQFHLTPAIFGELERLNQDPTVDVVLVPLQMMELLKKAGITPGKERCVLMADRLAKMVYPDRFVAR